MTTHVMEEAEELCTDIALMSQGRLIQMGLPAIFSKRSTHSANPGGAGGRA